MMETNNLDRLEHMNIVVVGHVDHGKSTVIGRLLADTGSLPQGKLEQIREMCRRNDKPFEYAFLLDALKDERSQGITIDTARCFFHTRKRRYIIIDAPGHIEFLKNMITGASRASAALLVIDAHEGVQENSRRHGTMLSMLGIHQICVMVNKMDMVGYDQSVFEKIVGQYGRFLDEIGIKPEGFIPVSALEGDNIAAPSANMPWYSGPTVLEMLDEFHAPDSLEALPLRMPVQDVYKFTHGDDRRIIAGTVETGSLHAGDEVVFYPSGKRTHVNRIEPMRSDETEGIASAGYAAGFTMKEQIYVRRGEICARACDPAPKVADRMRVNLFWLGNQPMVSGKIYHLKCGTAKLECRLERILGVMDASNLHHVQKQQIDRHDVAECILATDKPCAFDDTGDLAATNRFVIVDDYEISGGGIFMEACESTAETAVSAKAAPAWQRSALSFEERCAALAVSPRALILSGANEEAVTAAAAAVERALLSSGKPAYCLGVAPAASPEERAAALHALPEQADLLTDAGVTVVSPIVRLSAHEEREIRERIPADRSELIWLGEGCPFTGTILPEKNAAESILSRLSAHR